MASVAEKTTERKRGRMDQFITAFVDGMLVPVINVFVTGGLAFVVFVVVWIGFAAALVGSQGSLDAAWHWIRGLPFIPQAIVWLLFLPVVIALWIWETTWPLVLRIVLIAGIGAWNVWIFLPRALLGRP